MGRRRSPLRSLLVAAALLASAAPGAAEEGRPEEDLEAILGGFDDEPPVVEPEAAEEVEDARRWWDVSGSLDSSISVNYLGHRSSTGTDYGGLQRFRNRLNLQLDVDFPDLRAAEGPGGRRAPSAWKLRIAGYGFWDAAYLINGRDDYTDEVLDDYELDADVSEAWILGKVHRRVDLKVGRQVASWGRSETLRVLDVLNPIDNREPGRVDLEDLRRGVFMARGDVYAGPWSLSLIAIPEILFDHNPVFGSDFYPFPVDLEEERPDDFRTVELAAALTGIFSGFDVSFHGAWYYDDFPRLGPGGVLVHDRLWLVGAGGNYTLGSWLAKAELAYLDGFGFPTVEGERGRLDVLVGLEYYGLTKTSIAVEGLNRHLFDHEDAILQLGLRREDAQELAVRVTRTFLHERASATLLAFWQEWDGSDGSIVRLDAEYDLRDALTATVGILLYQGGDIAPFSGFARNDRLIFRLKWSF